MTYGELDVHGHAWAPTLHEVLRTLLPPASLASASTAGKAPPREAHPLSAIGEPPTPTSSGAGVAAAAATASSSPSVVPLMLRDSEASRRRAASTAPLNELTAPLYAAPLPVGGGALVPSQRVSPMAAEGDPGSCRALGFEVHWNAAFHEFPGAPSASAGVGNVWQGDDAPVTCTPTVQSAAATSPQQCCALCAAAGGAGAANGAGGAGALGGSLEAEGSIRVGAGRRRGACQAWSYFAPRCYWSFGCPRTLADRQVMWGAVAGLRRRHSPVEQ